jgi:peptidoglycan/xylan/chitin deacetylase (PgdA/CDA1 family)
MKSANRLLGVHGLALLALISLIITTMISPAWLWLPLALFVAVCFLAPFFPSLGYYLPVISHGNRTSQSVALTFDDGPDLACTAGLLDLLDKYKVQATFFVVGRKAASCPDLIARMKSAGHEIGNHSYSHDLALMLRSSKILRQEIELCQQVLESLGIECWAFRPPVGIVNPRLGPVLDSLGLRCVTFRFRGKDQTIRQPKSLAKRVLGKVRSGDLVALHDTNLCPQKWLAEVETILDGLKKRNLKPVTLSSILLKP